MRRKRKAKKLTEDISVNEIKETIRNNFNFEVIEENKDGNVSALAWEGIYQLEVLVNPEVPFAKVYLVNEYGEKIVETDGEIFRGIDSLIQEVERQIDDIYLERIRPLNSLFNKVQ